jgi:uncharacterized protein (DUF433 family)
MAAVEIFPGVTSDPETWSGKPMIKNTRIPVSLVIALLAGGMSLENLHEEYHLTADQVHTALDYAAAKLEALEDAEIATGQHVEVLDVQHP